MPKNYFRCCGTEPIPVGGTAHRWCGCCGRLHHHREFRTPLAVYSLAEVCHGLMSSGLHKIDKQKLIGVANALGKPNDDAEVTNTVIELWKISTPKQTIADTVGIALDDVWRLITQHKLANAAK